MSNPEQSFGGLDKSQPLQQELPPNHFAMPSDMTTVKQAMAMMKTHP